MIREMNLFYILVIFYFLNNNHFVGNRFFLFSLVIMIDFYYVFEEKCLNEITNRMKYPSSSSMKYLVHRSVPKHNRMHQYEAIKSTNYDLSLSEILHPCLSGTSIIIQIYDPTEIPTRTVDDYLE